MHKRSIGGWLAAVSLLVFASAAGAQSAHQAPAIWAAGDIFEAGYMPVPAHAPTTELYTYGAGSGIERTTQQFADFNNVVQGDIFAAGNLSAADLQYPSRSRLSHADAFAFGTDEYSLSPEQIAQAYNNDPLDPFFYAIPGTQGTDIFARQSWPNMAWAPSLQGATNGWFNSEAPTLVGRTNGWITPRHVAGWNTDDRTSRRQGKGTYTASTAPVAGWKYNPSQPRWEPNRLPIKIYISGYVEAARGGLVREAITSALRQWSQASNGAIRYQITSRFCEADVHFVDGLTDDHEFAQTCVDYHKGPIDHAKVIFLLSTLTKLPEARVKGLCLHEIGHVFGILKHSKNDRDAMSEMAIDEVHPITILSEKDKHVMAALYQRWNASNNVTLRVASTISNSLSQTK